MKLRIAVITLALFSAQASAEWEVVDANDEFITWLDRSSIRKQDNIKLAWIMFDYYLPKTHSNGKEYKSIKLYVAYKCNEMQTGMKSFIMHSDEQGKGDVVANASGQIYDIEFADIPPRSNGEAMFKQVCGT